ncbi:E3 ubiquitin-protein ligase RNF170-like [Centruroides vittatus]|uniref:E3 ubiquitin-protein ligase RNF170-like n=1 Tax=Centruroides vittatus TaxID=120091 RepID=UPI00350F1B1A
MLWNEYQLVEGVGNEVFLATAGFILVVTFIIGVGLTHWRWQQYHPITIHQQSQDTVDTTRRHLVHFSNRLVSDASVPGVENMANPQHFGADNQCPICLNEPRFPIETNCGHLFCAQCVVLYWRHGNWRGAVRCPVCRQQVTVLLRCFRDQENNSSEREERNQILWDVNDYNRRFSGEPRPWLDYVWDLPTLLRHLGSEFFSVGGLMYMFRLRIVLCFVAAIMYLISPLDMIPEAVFGILGLLDDLFVVLLLAIYVTIIYRRFLAARWQEENS